MPHCGYLINLGNPDPEKQLKSIESLVHELNKADELDIQYLVMHPGSAVDNSTEENCINLIGQNINQVHQLTKSKNTIILLEATAGQGSNVGYKFIHLKQIIDLIEDKSRVGVCLDTQHIFAAGYDISNEYGYKKTMDEFENVVGLQYLKGVHINDSKTKLGSRKDRHEEIGKGLIGLEFFQLFMNDTRFDNMPLVLETNPQVYKSEIQLLKSFIK